jgi:hypothetical protein
MTSLKQSLNIDDLDETFAESVLKAYNIHVRPEATAINNTKACQAIGTITERTKTAFDTYLKGQSMVVVQQPGQTGSLAIAYIIGPGNTSAISENFKTWLLSKLDGVAGIQKSNALTTLTAQATFNLTTSQQMTNNPLYNNAQVDHNNIVPITSNGVTNYKNSLYEVIPVSITLENELFPVLLATPQRQSGSGREKVKVLGRVRNVIKEGRRKFVMVKGVKMSLTEAKRLSRAAATRK